MSDQEWAQALRRPFPDSLVGKLPRAGIQLDYVGHGAVTDRLLEVDPLWTWEPVAFDDAGLPLMERDENGNPISLWIRLTVKGVTRFGVGTCPGNQRDAEKVLIGDAIRNAAMRFGVALDLWIKGHAEDDEKHTAGQRSDTQRGQTSKPGQARRISATNAEALADSCAEAGLEVAEVVKLGTKGRTDDPAEVRIDEISAVREARDSLTPEPAA